MMNICTKFLSKRGQYTFSQSDFIAEYINRCSANPFHPKDNPEGVANLGAAEDKLMEPEIQERLSANDVFKFIPSQHQHYFQLHGKDSLRVAIANFLNKYFNVAEEISPENLIVMSGTTSCLDSLSFALFDPDDIYLIPTPTYTRIFIDFNERSLAQPYPLELPEEPNSDGKTFVLNSQLLENRILQLKNEGKTVKGFVLLNPHNPLGDVYSSQLVRNLLDVCAKYEIHVIIDEVYAITLLNTEAEVISVLSIDNLPDPQRTHFVWALSKDFGLAGVRLGVIHTKNSAVLKVLKNLSSYCPCASIIQDMGTTLLNDTKWIEEVFIPRRRQLLQERYQMAKNRLEQMGAIVRPAQAGFFVWFNLKRFLRSLTKEGEIELFEEILNAGVLIFPGTYLFCNTPGWFRMIFSMSSAEMERGLKALESVLNRRNTLNNF